MKIIRNLLTLAQTKAQRMLYLCAFLTANIAYLKKGSIFPYKPFASSCARLRWSSN